MKYEQIIKSYNADGVFYTCPIGKTLFITSAWVSVDGNADSETLMGIISLQDNFLGCRCSGNGQGNNSLNFNMPLKVYNGDSVYISTNGSCRGGFIGFLVNNSELK